LSGATVTAYPVGSSTPAGSATTTDGSYEINGLPYGSYLVEFTDSGYTTQWFDDQTSSSTANPVTVSPTANGAASANLQAVPVPVPALPAALSEDPLPRSPSTALVVGGATGASTAHFEYGPVSSTWCTSGGDSGSPAGTTNAPTTPDAEGIGTTLTGLTSGVAYCVRVTATNANGTSTSPMRDWQQIGYPTPSGVQIVSTGATEATVDASIIPKPVASYYAEYGLASSPFCSQLDGGPKPRTTPAQTVTSNDWTAVSVSVKLSGLTDHAHYCAEIVALTYHPLYADQAGGIVSTFVLFTAGEGASTGSGTVTLGKPKTSGATLQVSAACAAGGASCVDQYQVSVTEKLHNGKVVAVTASNSKPAQTTKVIVLGTAKVTLTAGKRKAVKLTLNAAGKKLLAKYRTLKTKLAVTTKSGTKTQTLKTTAVTFKATK
jgi:hypothetical protein